MLLFTLISYYKDIRMYKYTFLFLISCLLIEFHLK